MTEAEWLKEADNKGRLLYHLRDHHSATRTKVGKRKLRLFACCCCRLLWGRLSEPELRHAVLMAERFAEGDADKEDLTAAGRAAWRVVLGQSPREVGIEQRAAASMAAAATAAHPFWAAMEVSPLPFLLDGQAADVAMASAIVCDLLRCVFGNPFRPLTGKPPAHVAGLAREIYAAFPEVSDRYLLLADALADLGRDEASGHCRQKRHLKGCHVLDWATGRV